MRGSYQITITPDANVGGVAVLEECDGEYVNSTGWAGNGPRTIRPSPADWLRLLRRHIKLPKPVRTTGLRWDNATVRPTGWSMGAGHAPHGIVVRWEW